MKVDDSDHPSNAAKLLKFQIKFAARFNPIERWPDHFYHTLYSCNVWPSGTCLHNIADPAIAKEVLSRHEDFPKAALGQTLLKPVMGNGLVTAEGDQWRRQRRVIAPAFRRQIVDGYFGVVANAAKRLSERLCAQDGQIADVRPVMAEVTLTVLLESLFTSDGDAHLRRQVAQALGDYLTNLGDIEGSNATAAIASLQAAAREIISLRRNRDDSPADLLSLLLQSAQEDSPALMSTQEVQDNIVTFLLAGHETTATALTWTLYLLGTHEEAQERVHREILEVIPDPDFFSASKMEELRYLQGVVLESLRLYPPLPNLFRIALKDDVIGEHPVRKGDILNILLYPMHRNSLLWPQPAEFRPERFEDADARDEVTSLLLPFSIGPRGCIGSRLATMEMVVVTAEILRRCRVSIPPAYAPRPTVRVALQPSGQMPLNIEKRHPASGRA